MSRRVRVVEILEEAKKREKSYDWAEAAKLCKRALGAAGKEDYLKKGQIYERIGYALYRTALQAESVGEFKDQMRQAVAGYEKAKRFYRKLSGQGEKPRTLCCDAKIAYVSHWLASEVPEKKRLLDDCWKTAKESLRALKEAGNAIEYGKAYNQLSMSLWFSLDYTEDSQRQENITKEAVEHGEQAIKLLSKCRDSHELARAYVRTASFLEYLGSEFRDLDDREKNCQRARGYSRKAIELSEEVAFLEAPLGLLVLDCGGMGTDRAQKNLDKVWKYVQRTRDKFIVGNALGMLSHQTIWRRGASGDPEERARFLNRALEYAEEAKRQYSKISLVSPTLASLWPEAPYAEYYSMRAYEETNLSKRGELLEKAMKAIPDLISRAEKSGVPYNIYYAHHVASKAFTNQAVIETKSKEKRRLLEGALEHCDEALRYHGRDRSFDYWNHGILQFISARTRCELAKLAKDLESEKNMLQEATADLENALRLCFQHVAFREWGGIVSPLRDTLSAAQYTYGNWLKRLYDITHNREYLTKAIKAFEDSAESAQKLNLTSRMAEANWKIAQMHDALGKHLKAAENFESASENYTLAAEKVPQLSGFYSDYSSYMRAWAEIQRSRHERENENYAKSRLHYRLCSGLLRITKKWSYLSPYYFAWSLLEHGETLSRLDKPREAIKAFNEAGGNFVDSARILHETAGKLENSEERDEAVKLSNISGLRKQYCTARVLMEEAKLSNRKCARISSANKYASAAGIFKEIAPNLEREDAREELQFAAATCRAWEKLELAEERGDAPLYRKAANLFAKASEISRRKAAKLTAMGSSCFCEALEMGIKFTATSNMDFYSRAKLRLENAVDYYRRARFEKLALWIEATKKLFDAHVYVGKAEAEPEPEKRVKFYLLAEKCLELSAKSYGKAGYSGKKNEVLQSLNRARKERELAFSLSEVLSTPAVLSSATGVSMPDLTENSAGLNGFESVNIRARVSVPEKFVPGAKFEVKLDLANVGKTPGLLVRIDGIVPLRSEVLRAPSYCTLEGTSLNMKGKRLDPLSVESISVWVQISDMASVSLSPRVVYVDELGNFKTAMVEEVKILPVVEFESEAAEVVFSYLVDAFVEDCVKRRLGVETSGWRSFPKIIRGAGVPKRSLYGASGRLGHGLSELQRKGLVDLETFRGERGRGGHILKVRIHHKEELVRRYVKEKAPGLSM
jgi:hypothetical protein